MRTIVSSKAICDGQWRLDGTRLTVGQLKRMLTNPHTGFNWVNKQYPWLELTEEEANAIIAFVIPPIHAKPEMYHSYDTMVIRCVCGDDVLYERELGEIGSCPSCGRSYRLMIEQVNQT